MWPREYERELDDRLLVVRNQRAALDAFASNYAGRAREWARELLVSDIDDLVARLKAAQPHQSLSVTTSDPVFEFVSGKSGVEMELVTETPTDSTPNRRAKLSFILQAAEDLKHQVRSGQFDRLLIRPEDYLYRVIGQTNSENTTNPTPSGGIPGRFL